MYLAHHELESICIIIVTIMTLPADARFQNTGLERAGPVSTDIDNLAAEYSLQKPEPATDGPGNNYAK